MVSVSNPNISRLTTLIVDSNLDMGAYDLLSDDIKESSANNGVDVDGVAIKDDKIVSIDAIDASAIPKEASDNLRNSHDAEEYNANVGVSYIKIKTFTFTNGIKGTLRVTWQMQVGGTTPGYGRLYKNGAALGSIKPNSDGAYGAAETEDVDVGEVAPGETLELYVAGADASTDVWAKNFRLSYDSEPGAAAAPTS